MSREAETRSVTSHGSRGKARSLRDSSSSKRTLDPEYPVPSESQPDRKKLIPTAVFLSHITFAGGPIDPPPRNPRRDTRISPDNVLAKPTEATAFAPKSKDAHRYRCTNSSSVPYLSGHHSDAKLPARKRPQEHLTSSIPYLSNDGFEPKYEPKDPNYRSAPIWLREADDCNTRKRMSVAKKESLRSSFFDGNLETPTHSTPKIKALALGESFAEKPMFNSRKPKPDNVRNPFASSFALT